VSASQDVTHGAWARRAASVDGSPRFETQHVVWIQVGTCYADVRVPFHEAAATRCFAGRSGWDGGDRYRWHRRIDSEPFTGEDVGELSWDGGALVERGMFPTSDGEAAYVEEWVRLPGSDGPFLALEADDACMVRAGDHAITMLRADDGVTAVYRTRRDGSWADILTVGIAPSHGPDDPPMWPVIHRGTTEVLV